MQQFCQKCEKEVLSVSINGVCPDCEMIIMAENRKQQNENKAKETIKVKAQYICTYCGNATHEVYTKHNLTGICSECADNLRVNNTVNNHVQPLRIFEANQVNANLKKPTSISINNKSYESTSSESPMQMTIKETKEELKQLEANKEFNKKLDKRESNITNNTNKENNHSDEEITIKTSTNKNNHTDNKDTKENKNHKETFIPKKLFSKK